MHVAILVAMVSAGILSGILDAITGLIVEYGYPAVFAAAFLEVIFPPIPSEVIFPLVGFIVQSRGLGIENIIGMATVGALGSTAGAVAIYFVSAKVGRAAIARFGKRVRISEQEIEKAERWFEKYGSIAEFVGYTFVGSLLWCIILTFAGYYLGEAWSKFSEQASSADSIVTFIVIAALIAGVAFWYSKRKRASAKQ